LTILVTGGAGFIGSNFIRHWLAHEDEPVINVDKLTYAGNLASLGSVADDPRHSFSKTDICDGDAVLALLEQHDVRGIVHLAAESHVDRSIHGPADFIRTNVTGTLNLLQATRTYLETLTEQRRAGFRFINVSTDEVYGSLGSDDAPFTETHPYRPNSPYSASKASADHLARAYFHTYGLPVITTNCSNNYGPLQFPEKLIPLVILNATSGEPLPVYGDGMNVRDWLFVTDHCEALRQVLARGQPGSTYNIGGDCERANIEVVRAVCRLLDDLRPRRRAAPRESLITFVADRPGHDRRYAIDAARISIEIGWRPAETFETGLEKTVTWYLENDRWIGSIVSGEYRDWVDMNYGSRAGRT